MTTTGSLRGLLTAREVNSFRSPGSALDIEMTAANAPIPVAFGNVTLPGLISLVGLNAGGDTVYRVCWCAGEIYQIDSVFINDAAPPASVEIRHYRGAPHQGVDDLVEAITTLTGYDETMVVAHPDGFPAVAYSVFRIPAAAGIASPRFQAIARGSVVYDARRQSDCDYIFDDAVTYNLDFTVATSGTPTTGVDLSSYAHTVTWTGNAQVSGGVAIFDGNGDYLTLQDTTNADFGSDRWTLEVTVKTTDTTGTQHIYAKGDVVNDRAIVLLISTDDLYVSMSSTGTTWDIASLTLVKTAFSPTATNGARITIEYTEREYHFYIDGVHELVIQDDSPLYATTRPVRLGLYDGGTATDGFNGSIYGVRFTKGVNRYGGVHSAAAIGTAGLYQDDLSIKPGYIYSATPSLALGEMARNKFHGLGVTTVNNELEAVEFNEELLPSGVARAQFGLVLDSVRATEEWMDLIATYAECVWFFYDDGIYIKPLRLVTAKHPAGWEMGENGQLLVDASAWTAGTGWTYYGSDLNLFQKAAGVASSVSQAMVKPFEAGVTYCAIMDVLERSAGTVGLTLNSVPLIAAVSAAGRYAYEFTATGAEDGLTLACNADSAFVGQVGEISIKRKYWPESRFLKGTLTFSAQPNSDSPTSVSVQYTTPSTTTANWLSALPVIASMPGVEEGSVPLLETNLDLRGVQRIEEAENKALTKLMQLQNMLRVSWISIDRAIAFRRGFVVEVTDPETATNVMVLIDSVTATTDAGRFRVSGMRYDETHYPSEADLPTATIPVGAITVSRGDTIPSGWAAYTAANGRFIKGAGATITADATGGASTLAALSGNTVTGGDHGPTDGLFYVDGFTATGGSASGNLYTATAETAGGHVHTYNTGTITPELYAGEIVFVQKITSTSTTMPGNLLIFGQAGLKYRNTTRFLFAAGRLAKAAAVAALTGVKEQVISLTTGSTNDNHEHYTRSATTSGSPSVLKTDGVAQQVFLEENGGAAHTHDADIRLIANVKKYSLCLYAGTDDFGVGPGMMFLWGNSALPTDYTLCNGLLGTPDLEDYFIELAAEGDEDNTAGDNTLEIRGETKKSPDHEHKGASDANYYSRVALSHDTSLNHRHDISSSGHAWQPPWYALSVIMYNPSPIPTYADVGFQFTGGTAGATPTDSGPDAVAITNSGSPGIKWSASQTLFGLNTLASGGTANFFRTPSTFQIGPKFTVEGFFRATTFTSNVLLGNRSGTTANRFRLVGVAGAMQLLTGTGSATSGAITTGVWYYFSVNYDGAQWRLYLGLQSAGVATLIGSISETIASMPAVQVCIGGDFAGNNPFAGFYSEIRHTRGVAKHSGSAIAIPTEALTTS